MPQRSIGAGYVGRRSASRSAPDGTYGGGAAHSSFPPTSRQRARTTRSGAPRCSGAPVGMAARRRRHFTVVTSKLPGGRRRRCALGLGGRVVRSDGSSRLPTRLGGAGREAALAEDRASVDAQLDVAQAIGLLRQLRGSADILTGSRDSRRLGAQRLTQLLQEYDAVISRLAQTVEREADAIRQRLDALERRRTPSANQTMPGRMRS
jgi:hypothetical protein